MLKRNNKDAIWIIFILNIKIYILYFDIYFSDEEINAVSRELQKYGIQMPAFQKIGGLLTNSIATDTAALHAAVIAINQAVIDNVMFRFI